MSFIFMLGYTAIATPLIPIAAGFKIANRFDRALWLIFLYVIFSFGFDISSIIASHLHNSNTNISNAFSLVQFPILAYAYAFCYSKDNKIKPYIHIGIISVNFIFCLLYIKHFNTNVVNSLTSTITWGFALLMSLYYLGTLLFNIQKYVIEREPFFWVSAGFLICSVCSILQFANFSILTELDVLKYLWIFKLLASILCNIFIAIAFRVFYKNNLSSAKQEKQLV